MKSYGAFERKLARSIAKYPRLKKRIKLVYTRVVYFFERKKYLYKTSYKIKRYGCEKESFFGYYDKSPVSESGNLLVNYSARKTCELPDSNNSILICVIEQDKDIPCMSIATKSFNWQQGARAQWLDDDLFIFNDYDLVKDRYVAKVYSVRQKKEIKCFLMPVQDAFGLEYYLSINYSRLLTLRPDYGYRNKPNLTEDELNNVSDDGIWRVEYDTGAYKLLISIKQLLDISNKKDFENAKHKVNHVMISPSGKHFIFLHRYIKNGFRKDRLMIAESKCGNMRVLSDNEMISHCTWVDENTVLGYMRGPNGKDGYWVIDVNNGFIECLDILKDMGDGHPSVFKEWLVTDTYPDKSRMQRLLMINLKTREEIILGEFYHGFRYNGETRCDLHPRISPDGKSVFFDSVFDGKRKLYKMELKK